MGWDNNGIVHKVWFIGGKRMELNVYSIRIKLYIMDDIFLDNLQEEITSFLDKSLSKTSQFVEWHNANKYKYYCYDSLFPIEKDKVYKKDRIYTLTIRTIDAKLAKYFTEYAVNTYTNKLKGLTAQVRILPKKHIDVLYTLTPAILKCQTGYWKEEMTIEQYEERMKVNLIKKWNSFHGEKIAEDFEIFTGVEFLNKCPVSSQYKGVKLLGDKIRIHVAENQAAQRLAYMALGTGVLEINSRGFGYVNYRWL